MKKCLISVIVPAYNEEKKIGGVLKSLINSSLVDEIIIINDGSSDNTLSIVRKFKKIKLINLKKNHGKSYAIVKGIEKSIGDIVVFIDADLTGLNDSHLAKLTNPLILGKKEVVIGYPNDIKTDKLFLPLSGERAYWKKNLTPYLREMSKKGYGLELYLNYIFRNKKMQLFPLNGVKTTLKYEKQTYDIVAKLFLVESFDILSEILKQQNPISYLLKSYLYSFYIKKPNKNNNQIDKLIKYVKNNLIKKINL
ncbi:MAG: Glycosyl transferase [Candidatus Roizmanbacteria bacterium GW2011_GWA2_33_33]|uniref:Glycosyl transferase n=2 Tax=Candidatus Roizmaniibacteriota TaxID=1752723 RepID=A0A0G0E2X4_9BACT|nr:MAG: Glycosyl transferase [Candidatus Roizmanbacteria bacterium GW2011_GWA2_33_33]KKP61712.1 MAG: Glycosyl transferase [Candidatus Roizmanbacteria bacterium GW2011_GWC2_34_23]